MIFYITRRIKHNLVKGLAMAILLGFLGWFLLLFNGFITQKQIEIDRAYETMPVSVVISNLQGTQTDNLWIPESVIDYFIRDSYSYLGKQEPVAFSSYVKDVKIKSTLYYTITANPALADKGESENQKIVGITSTAAEPALSQTEGVQIHYFVRDGEAKLGSGEPVCIVSESFLNALTMDADGKYRMVLQVHTSPDANEAKTISVEIIGCYTKADNTIYCSWNTVAEIQKLLSGEIIADSLEATIRDNRELDAFRVLLKRHFAQVNPTMPTTNLPTQPSPEYVETLKKYMEVSGAADMYKNLVPQMFAALKQQLPNVPADVWDSLEKELNTPTLFDDIVKAFAPVYEKLLTKEDLEEIIKFYETPVGQKLAKAQPAIMDGNMQVMQQIQMPIVQRVQQVLQEKGLLPTQPAM